MTTKGCTLTRTWFASEFVIEIRRFLTQFWEAVLGLTLKEGADE